MKTPPSVKNRRNLEWIFSSFGALNCIIIAVLFTIYQLPQTGGGWNEIWPFPLIYLVEIGVLGIIVVLAVSMVAEDKKSNWSIVPWICSGILVAFVILGAWTIGFYLIPAMLLFIFVGIFIDRRTHGDIPLHIIFFVVGAIAQASFVFLTLISI